MRFAAPSGVASSPIRGDAADGECSVRFGADELRSKFQSAAEIASRISNAIQFASARAASAR